VTVTFVLKLKYRLPVGLSTQVQTRAELKVSWVGAKRTMFVPREETGWGSFARNVA
jgi:hypothetical protein